MADHFAILVLRWAMGVLEWTPTNLSHFSSIFSLSGALSQKFIIRPFRAILHFN